MRFLTMKKFLAEKILGLFANDLALSDTGLASFLSEMGKGLKTLDDVSSAITKFVIKAGRKVVLMIDEVDKAAIISCS